LDEKVKIKDFHRQISQQKNQIPINYNVYLHVDDENSSRHEF